jgi:cytosine deaminase
MLDLVVRRTRLHKPTDLSSIAGDQTDQNTLVDVAIQGGKIVDIAPNLDAEAAKEIDASWLSSGAALRRSAFPHGRDAEPRPAAAERLRHAAGGIALWGELKPLLTVEAVVERALRYCDLGGGAGASGDPVPCGRVDRAAGGVEALLEVKKRVAPYIDLQLVAFPQDGLYRARARRRT